MSKTYRLLLLMAAVCAVALALLFQPWIAVRSGNVADDISKTEKAIRQFHTRLSHGRYEAIYREAHEVLRRAQSGPELIAAMRETRTRYGRIISVEASKLRVLPGAPVQIRAVYNISCEKAEATEMFVFFKEGDSVQLAMYRVFAGTSRP